jgi:hypothetical protein
MPAENGLSNTATIVALIVLGGFAGLLYYLFTISSGADEILWSRSMFLYGGVEALAFAAAGFLFGKEVHRQQAESAEARAREKTNEAEAAAKEAAMANAKGRSLAKAVAAKVAEAPRRAEAYGPLGHPEAAQSLARSDLEEIERFARELFPD